MIKSIYKKILIVTLLMAIFLVIITCCNKCFAIEDVVNDSYWENWRPKVNDTDTRRLSEKTNTILGVISIIGAIISVGSLAIIGIKIMLGSVEEKAQYKQKMVPWVIGATMVFAITTIPSIVYKLTNSTIINGNNSVNIAGGISDYEDYISGYDDAMKYVQDKNEVPSIAQIEDISEYNYDIGRGYRRAVNNLTYIQNKKAYAEAALQTAEIITRGRIEKNSIKDTYNQWLETQSQLTTQEAKDKRKGELDRLEIQMDCWGITYDSRVELPDKNRVDMLN